MLESSQQNWLLQYIGRVFDDVQLDGGMTIYEGESMDRYGDADEDAKAVDAERTDWRRVPIEDLHERSTALGYLDAKGIRFYTPAIMSTILRDEDQKGLLTDSFLFHLHDIRKSCLAAGTPYHELYHAGQRAAIVRFVKHLIHNLRGGHEDDALAKTLIGLQRCAQQSASEQPE